MKQNNSFKTVLASLMAMLLCAILAAPSASAQVYVTNPYPEYQVKVKSCKAIGNDVVITLIVQNISNRDYVFSLKSNSAAYDDEANVYKYPLFADNTASYRGGFSDAIPSNIKHKVLIKIENVDVAATQFDKVVLSGYSQETKAGRYLNLTQGEIVLNNVPISRAGN